MRKQFLKEVRQFQKIAGILKEGSGNLRVVVDEGDSILEFTDVKNIEDLNRRIQQQASTNPAFEAGYEWYIDAPHQLEVADQEAQYLFDEPIDSIPSTYVQSFEEWANDIAQHGNDVDL